MLPETQTLESQETSQKIQLEIDRIVQQAKKDAAYLTGRLQKSIFGIVGNRQGILRVRKTEVVEFEMIFYGVYNDNSNLIELVPSQIYGHPTVIYFVDEYGNRLDMTKSDKYIATPQGAARTYKSPTFVQKVPKVEKAQKFENKKTGYNIFDFNKMLNVFKNKQNEPST